jgi:hypothetical protein
MAKDREATNIQNRARELLRTGMPGGFPVRKSGRVKQPIPVLESDGELHSWFVPVTVGDLLAGFFEFQTDLTFMRYSSFQRQEDSLEGCPAAESWTDVKAIQRLAATNARPGEKAGEPFLTYDRSPSRLVWAVALESPDGTTRTVHVAGSWVWKAPATDARMDSFGGR